MKFIYQLRKKISHLIIMEKQKSKDKIISPMSAVLLGLFVKQSRLNNKINKIDKENTAKILKEDLELKLLNDYLSYEVMTKSGRRILRNITMINWSNPNLNNIYIQNSLNKYIIKPGFLDDKKLGVKYDVLVEDGFFGTLTTTALVNTINYVLKKNKKSLDFYELIPTPSSVEELNTQLISDDHWEFKQKRNVENLIRGEKNNESKDNLFTVSLKYSFNYFVENHREFLLDLSHFFRICGVGKKQQQGIYEK